MEINKHASQLRQLAAFVHRTSFGDLKPDLADQLKRHLLDSIGSCIHATGRPTIEKLARHIRTTAGPGNCRVPMIGTAPIDRAAQLYTALIRYPDFMDNYLGKEATCHPCDNIGGLLAVAQWMKTDSRELLTAIALSYAIECRLVEEIPVMIKGFDHTVLLAYSVTAAMSRLLRLSEEETAHALAIAGCSMNPLVTCRASYTYEWKGLASSLVVQNCVNICLLAKEGMTGPLALFEGPKGFEDIYGMKLKHEWSVTDLDLIKKCSLKEFNAEVHTQSVLEAVLDLKNKYEILPEQVDEINVTTFLTCLHIVGGGAYGDRKVVHSKEQADHSLPYTVAVALADGCLYPDQLLPDRINRPDVQALLQKVNIHTSSPLHRPVLLAGLLDPYTEAYPEKLSAKVTITFTDGHKVSIEKQDYHGYYTRPFDWTATEDKLRRLTVGWEGKEAIGQIISLCRDFEDADPAELIDLLAHRQNQQNEQYVSQQ